MTSSAARSPARRRPRSFHAAMSDRAAPVYATAARAEAKPMRRPVHSRQRSTGQSVGAPQRPQLGDPTGCRELRHASQTTGAESPQETQ
jgi:hypothetical protein